MNGHPDNIPLFVRDYITPRCKGCGSRNIKAIARAIVYCEYYNPSHIEDGALHFAFSATGNGENETWRYECEDCGRGLRLKLAPVNDD